MKRSFEEDYLKAAKKAAREVFGFQLERVSTNKKKYSRKREKYDFRLELKNT